MKVIKPPLPMQPMALRCPHCTAELQAETAHDFTRITGSDQRDNIDWDYAVCVCPCCAGTIRVEKKEFPAHIYNKLRTDYYR